ncbi:MFS general substrate transporter [Aspergillus pseudotamarii]|uniref:MFS general substrate transporter n=1 Tax=Aspergillus pseudotamarii TaxID=132259 RepID=A0A5N6T0Y3_ASPPS|nr:MFS general substrate transporter [Aspergillus pseudotamarii]KAE8139930.1 MFS general substrate transporter [Aspergillus pseudotamarii]
MASACELRRTSHDERLAGSEPYDVVDWDGPEDDANPLYWGTPKKVLNVACVSIFNFLTPLGSAMFAPGVTQVMEQFHSTSKPLSSFVVSVYLLGFAFGPLIVAPLSELYGRLPLYHGCNILFTLSNIACALAPSMSSLIGFRFLAGSAGSAPLALGAGTIADIMEPKRRGLAIAVWATGPVVGPVVGPVCGGFLTENASWRWVFWVIAILSGICTGFSFLFLRETYAPILLSRKTKRLIRETGHSNKRSALHSDLTPSTLFTTSITRPLKMLVFSPIISALSLYVAVVYGFLYLLFTTMSQVYGNQYHFTAGLVGLTYIGLGAGSTIGLLAMGRFSDVVSKRLAGGTKGSWKPEFRLALMIPLSLGLPIGLFWYGWAAEKKAHWILPIIGTGWIGIGVVASFVAIQSYLVDAFTTHAASAAAASTVLRSLLGAVLPLAGPSMYSALGLGWGNSVLAFIAIAMLPLPLVFFMYGERIREKQLFVF